MFNLYYDCEIKHCIPDKKQEFDPKYKYCNGWTDYLGMGISVIGYAVGDNPVTYSVSPFDDFKTILSKRTWRVIGFNSSNFDDSLCEANGIIIRTSLDLLSEIRFAAFGSTDWRRTPRGRTYSLGAIAKANGMAKSEDGADAPRLWQDNERKRVIDYCKQDTEILRDVFRLMEIGRLIDPNTGNYLQSNIEVPF